MKRIVICLLILLILPSIGQASLCSGSGVCTDSPCESLFFDSKEKAEAAPKSCGKVNGFAGAPTCMDYTRCPPISNENVEIGFLGIDPYGACLHLENEEYSVICYYYAVEPEEECCKENEKECCKPGQKICPDDKEGNPIRVLSGKNEERETDLEFNTAFEKGFKVYRAYNSHSSIDSPIGIGWNHSYHVSLDYLGSEDTFAFKIVDESGRTHHYLVPERKPQLSTSSSPGE